MEYQYRPGSAERPVLLLLHGTGGNEHSLLELGAVMDPEAALLSPRGQVLENGMPRFFRRLAEGVFDEEDLIRRTEDLAAWVKAARTEHGLENRPIVAVGYSNGANIAASLLLLHPEVLTGAILLRAMVPIHPEEMPSLEGTRVLLHPGEGDPLIPAALSEELARMLEACGAKVTSQRQPGGHQLQRQEIFEAAQWLRQTFPQP